MGKLRSLKKEILKDPSKWYTKRENTRWVIGSKFFRGTSIYVNAARWDDELKRWVAGNIKNPYSYKAFVRKTLKDLGIETIKEEITKDEYFDIIPKNNGVIAHGDIGKKERFSWIKKNILGR